jgi:branched-chain amino acid transport system substrate-binding protein
MQRPKLSMVATVMALIALAASACSSSTSGSSGSSSGSGSYSIGFIDSLSGLVGPYGQGQLKGAQTYVNYLNSHGGINGKKIHLTVLDDQSESATAVSDTLQMINQQHVLAIAGFALSDICDAALVPAAKANVSVLCIAAARNLLDPPSAHLFVSQVDVGDEVATEFGLAKHLVTNPSAKVAFVTTDAASNVSLRSGLAESASAAGWHVVANEIIPETATSMTTYVNAVIASKPDVVMGAMNETAAIALLRQFDSAGVKVPVIDYNGGDDVGTLQAVNNPNFYVVREYNYAYPSFPGAANATFTSASKSAGVNPNQVFVVNGYFQMYILAAALKKCGPSCTPAELTNTLSHLQASTGGLTPGPIDFTSTNHSALHIQNSYRWDPSTGMPQVVVANLPTGNVYPPTGG